MRVTIAVSGAGSLMGQGIIKALKMSTLDYRLVALDYFPHAVGLYWADVAHLLPDVLSSGVEESEWLEQLNDALRRNHVDVLLVATDFEVPLLAKHRAVVESETGCRVIVSSPEVAEIGDDKWATYQFLKAHGFPCPPSLVDLSQLEDFVAKNGFPLIVKPRRGARSRGVTLVRNMTELNDGLKMAAAEPIIQRAVGSPENEYTCGAVVVDGQCLGVIAVRRELRDGNTFRAYLEAAPDSETKVRAVALTLNPCGPANFQLRVSNDGPAIFEINVRFSGTTVIRALAGFNEVEAIVRWAVFGERVPLNRKKSGVVLRYFEELFVSLEEYQRMGEARVR